ncbi:PDZ and LIM domain protein Zasp isoform X3 [Patella vulgata]|uniref:PDZ and LIM domain protein Zasp isoform X3 n=1 Tax=Patella vulgata TaxID=6465 RepID=UPI00217FEE90|nr:PDZ and LIM domain protein Zasp isoform X3 [Patella vulgata]
MSVLTLEAKLERAETNTPWGFRMQGGKDFSSPLTIQKVNPGSLAAKCGLQVGDIILKIGILGAETLRHKEAQDTIVASGNRLDLLLQRIRAKQLNSSFGGGSTPAYDKFSTPQTSSFNSVPKAPPVGGGVSQPSSNSNFNASAKPFGAPSAPAYGGSNVDNLANRTKNMSMEPDYSGAAQKYSAMNEPPQPSSHQSSSFRYLQNMMDSGQEPPSAFKSSPAPPAAPPAPKPQTYIAQPVGPGEKPGTVKAIVSQKYNTPIGLYSDKNVATTFKGQSKFLVSPDEGPAAPVPYTPPAPAAPTWTPKPAPVPSAPVAKTWTPSAAPPMAPSAPRALAPRVPPPKPSGVGAIRGRIGDASMQNQGSGMIPKTALCASCGNTIRGPFVLAMGKSWCPEHFNCANPRCGRKLIDIGFVEEGGFLYCEQDYAQHFAPKCHKCTQAIVGECVNAIQQQWHPQCFLCTKCHQSIGGTQFHIEEGKPYCEKDWGAMFQTMCTGCEFPIEPGDRWVEAMNKNFHSECFYCATCQVSLEGQPFYCKSGKPFCKKHAR